MLLILCGLFGSGKTTCGQEVAQRLSLPFFDTDRIIERLYGQNKNVSEIWNQIGHEAYRTLETEAIFSLKQEPSIIATGGGSLLREENRAFLKSLGTSTCVYLQVTLPILYQRVLKRGFPSYLDQKRPFEHFRELTIERIPLYEEFATHTIDTSFLELNICVNKILELIQLH